MKKIVNNILEKLFFITPFKETPQSSITNHKPTFNTTMPFNNVSFEEWEKGKWIHFIGMVEKK